MINVGVIGTGGISPMHLAYLKARKDVRIAALCDVRPAALEQRRKQYGGQGFTDFRKMLEQVRLDAVWLCTPPLVREAPLLACAERGIPVFCEKPVEHDEARGRAIAAALARRKAKVQIGYLLRHTPLVQALRRAIRDDAIHLVHSFYACNFSMGPGLPAWFYDKSISGGGLVDQATHNMDLLRFLFGEIHDIRGLAHNPRRKKSGKYTVEEAIGVLFKFRNGIVGTHNHSWVAGGWRIEFTLSGEKRLYRVDLIRGTLTVTGPRFPKPGPVKVKLIPDAGGPDRVWFRHDGTELGRYENDAFLKQVISGDWSHNLSDYADGLKTLQLTLACDRAVTHGKATLTA